VSFTSFQMRNELIITRIKYIIQTMGIFMEQSINVTSKLKYQSSASTI
jgi:hypothetical protein